MLATEMVFTDGDRIHGWGRFVADEDGRWLDLTRVVALGMSSGPRPRNPRHSIALVGTVDEAGVPTDFGPSGVVPGAVTLTGVWEGSALRVLQQSPVRHSDFDENESDWTTPPCPAPPGGWPKSMAVNELDDLTSGLGDLRLSGSAVTAVWFSPGPSQSVLVISATDVERVRKVLAPQLPDRLCVIPSKWTRAELDGVRDTLRRNAQRWVMQTWGENVDALAQTNISAIPLRVTAELAAWADSLPPGLLVLRPALVPVGTVSP